MVSLQTPVCEFGKKAIDFTLPGVDQQQWTLEKCSGKRGLLILFISNHCPYVKAIRKKLVRDTRELMELGINSVAIMPNDTVSYPEDSFENMLQISNEFNFPFPYLLDETQEIARAYDAVCRLISLGITQIWNSSIVGVSMQPAQNLMMIAKRANCLRL